MPGNRPLPSAGVEKPFLNVVKGYLSAPAAVYGREAIQINVWWTGEAHPLKYLFNQIGIHKSIAPEHPVIGRPAGSLMGSELSAASLLMPKIAFLACRASPICDLRP